jgi:hypothetical protein
MLVIHTIVEGLMDEAAATRIIAACGLQPGTCYGKKGCTYIKQKIGQFNQTAKSINYLALVDFMDTGAACPAEVVMEWLPHPEPLMLFRVVVRELESWLLADRNNIASFLGVSVDIVPKSPESLPDPKQALINLARRSRKAKLREALVPSDGSTAREGRLYTSEMTRFIRDHWDLQAAREMAPSLNKCIVRVESLGTQ